MGEGQIYREKVVSALHPQVESALPRQSKSPFLEYWVDWGDLDGG